MGRGLSEILCSVVSILFQQALKSTPFKVDSENDLNAFFTSLCFLRAEFLKFGYAILGTPVKNYGMTVLRIE